MLYTDSKETMKKEADGILIKKKQIKEAVIALQEYSKKWEEGRDSSQKKPLLEEPEEWPILLTITLKKIPKLENIHMLKVPLPHTLVTDITEVCLITGDLDKRDKKADIEPTVQHYKELLSKHGVTAVSEIIPLRQLRTEYKVYEAKRNLYGAYDYFLADNRITNCLPKVLGKFFFKKSKFPQQINLRSSNVKKQIENALSRTVFFLSGRGNTCSAEVARLRFSAKHAVENIEAAINTLSANIPGTWKNIQGLYIKTPLSISIPLYMSLESGNDVELPIPEEIEDVEAEELTTLMGRKVKVYSDFNVEVLDTDESLFGSDDDEESEQGESETRKEEADTDEPVSDSGEEYEQRENAKIKEEADTGEPNSSLKTISTKKKGCNSKAEGKSVKVKEEVNTDKDESVLWNKKKKHDIHEGNYNEIKTTLTKKIAQRNKVVPFEPEENVQIKEEVSTAEDSRVLRRKKKQNVSKADGNDTGSLLIKKSPHNKAVAYIPLDSVEINDEVNIDEDVPVVRKKKKQIVSKVDSDYTKPMLIKKSPHNDAVAYIPLRNVEVKDINTDEVTLVLRKKNKQNVGKVDSNDSRTTLTMKETQCSKAGENAEVEEVSADVATPVLKRKRKLSVDDVNTEETKTVLTKKKSHGNKANMNKAGSTSRRNVKNAEVNTDGTGIVTKKSKRRNAGGVITDKTKTVLTKTRKLKSF